MRHNHNPNFYYDNKKISSFKKKEYKSPGKKAKTEIDDWEEISSNKKEKWESDEEITKNDFEQSYAFVEDSDENFDFNKMIKIKSKHIWLNILSFIIFTLLNNLYYFIYIYFIFY